MKSIIQGERQCYFCGSTVGLEEHHVFFGVSRRKISEREGFKAWLCPYHHRGGKHGVHGCRSLDLVLKRACQEEYEKTHTREEWLALIGRNYI